MPTIHDRVGIRERVSDSLLRKGIEMSLDTGEVARGLQARPDAPGYELASSAVALARLVDSAILWLSWRLRPRQIPAGR